VTTASGHPLGSATAPGLRVGWHQATCIRKFRYEARSWNAERYVTTHLEFWHQAPIRASSPRTCAMRRNSFTMNCMASVAAILVRLLKIEAHPHSQYPAG